MRRPENMLERLVKLPYPLLAPRLLRGWACSLSLGCLVGFLLAPLAPSVASSICTESVTVCGQLLQPLEVNVGGGFQVKIDQHYRAVFECSQQYNGPSWQAVLIEGSCEPVPVIELPTSYDERAAWRVG